MLMGTQNLLDSLRDQLVSVGYRLHCDAGIPRGPEKWWWTWAHPSGLYDIECGPDCTSAMAAWQSAMEDFFSEVTAHHAS